MKVQRYIIRIFALLLMFGTSSSAFAQTTKSASAEYNGNYMGRTVISKYLANFCEIPDDVIVGKIDVLKDCLAVRLAIISKMPKMALRTGVAF